MLGEPLTARGRVVHVKRSLGLSEVFIHDLDGRLLGHGSSLCFILPPVEPDPGASAEQAAGSTDTHHANPDPYERPAAVEVLPQQVWDRRGGLEVLEGQIKATCHFRPLVICSA
jgi:hypothetical protein